ncbi:unnamed protein product [Protopolystoma xenopodis]|uniref:Fibronectin type-III domain-containing protein n=1 Tax=Protopolystoma xenopodis TaxID=117903 RepID=A0A3S5A4W5_9PLAT|nr:unnamed protein product [Protopolystoma xenopodis]
MDIKVDLIESTSAQVTWNPPSKINGLLESFTVNLVPMEASSQASLDSLQAIPPVSVPPNETSVNLKDLQPCVTYELELKASTMADASGVGGGTSMSSAIHDRANEATFQPKLPS